MPAKQAVIFGAGAIGLAFLGDLFDRSGYAMTFFDVREDIVDALNRRGGYDIHIVGRDERRVRHIRRVHALNTAALGTDAPRRAAVDDAVADAAIIFTAAGERALAPGGGVLAAGLARRVCQEGLIANVVCCENIADPAAVLRDSLRRNLSAATWNELAPRLGISRSVISRMTPVVRSLDDITTEAYDEIPVEGATWQGAPPDVVGLRLVDNFTAYKVRKLIMHNMTHAVAALLGYFMGKHDVGEAMREPLIAAVTRVAMNEAMAALIAEFHLPRAEQEAHAEDLLRRYDNPALGHTIANVARDPIRKLKVGDRMMTAVRLAEKHGSPHDAMVFAVALALNYDHPRDAEAGQLQQMLAAKGLDAALADICEIRAAEPLAARVGAAYARARDAVAASRAQHSPAPLGAVAHALVPSLP